MNSESLHHGNIKSIDVIIPLMLSRGQFNVSLNEFS